MPHILVIEDELEKPLQNNLFIELLQGKGHVITCKETGNDAIYALENYNYDIVILDIMITPAPTNEAPHDDLLNTPRPDIGVVILNKIRKGDFEATGTNANVPVLVVSAVTGEPRWNDIKQLVPDFYILKKPCSPEEIVEKAQEILAQQQTRN